MEKLCVVVQRFDDGDVYDKRFDDVIKPVAESCGLRAYRVDRDPSAEVIMDRLIDQIKNAELVVAEISTDRPNVWLELGYAMGLSKPVIMICDHTRKEIPFDIRHQNILFYKTDSSSDFDKFKENLKERMAAKLGIHKEENRELSETDLIVLRKIALDQYKDNSITPENKVSLDNLSEKTLSEDSLRLSLRSLLKHKYLVFFRSTENDAGFYQLTEKAERILLL